MQHLQQSKNNQLIWTCTIGLTEPCLSHTQNNWQEFIVVTHSWQQRRSRILGILVAMSLHPGLQLYTLKFSMLHTSSTNDPYLPLHHCRILHTLPCLVTPSIFLSQFKIPPCLLSVFFIILLSTLLTTLAHMYGHRDIHTYIYLHTTEQTGLHMHGPGCMHVADSYTATVLCIVNDQRYTYTHLTVLYNFTDFNIRT